MKWIKAAIKDVEKLLHLKLQILDTDKSILEVNKQITIERKIQAEYKRHE